jgi:adenylate cyclase
LLLPFESMPSVRHIHDWLVAGAPGVVGPAAVVGRVSDDALAAGIPVHRVAAYVRTLHPHIMGRQFIWQPGAPVRVREAPYEVMSRDEFIKSPFQLVARTREPHRVRIAELPAPREAPILDDLAAEGFVDYFAAPLPFLSGETHAITFATKAPGGFRDEDIEAILSLIPPLARVAEILALSRTAASLLDAYVGRGAGEQILAGKIQRGDFDTIRAVIWCSDLRGFTELAGRVEPVRVIRFLNDLFDSQVTAIDRRGGEVLKFIGDGLLAIFPIDETDRPAARQCDAALDATADALGALKNLNDANVPRGDPALRFGLALHVGDVAYGNIGGKARLDFTCIGPAVNLASRLEGLTSRLGRPVVASEAFAGLTTRPMKDVGSFELKGVAGAQRVFAPAEGELLTAW